MVELSMPDLAGVMRAAVRGLLIEYDNTQDRANHIHSVWRDLRRDFAGDLLASTTGACATDRSINGRDAAARVRSGHLTITTPISMDA